MKPVSADELLPFELAALMHFYAESGVAWLSEDEALDRFAESLPSPPAIRDEARSSGGHAEAERRPAPSSPAPAVAVPDAEAVEAARGLAAHAETAEALVAAVGSFEACNLRFSARHTIFADGNFAARIVVLGGVPSADDDREGKPFSGAVGRILERMMKGIGVGPDDLLMAHTIPWRPPGNRAPTVREVEICAPFARRLIEIVRPDAVLVLGNLAVRILSDEPRAGIHGLRGKWFDLPAGGLTARAFATFHPEELVATPISKRLVWQDLLRFRTEMAGVAAAAP
jgi:uracil-DNA glycosylase